MPQIGDPPAPDPRFDGHTLDDFCDQSCGGCTDTTDPRVGMQTNIGYPRPSALRRVLDDFDLRSDIYIGARYDLDPGKHFLGKISLLKVYSSPLSDAESHCLFFAGDILIASVGEHSGGGGGGRRQLGSEGLLALRSFGEEDETETETETETEEPGMTVTVRDPMVL